MNEINLKGETDPLGFGFVIFDEKDNFIKIKDKSSLAVFNGIIALIISTSALLFMFKTFMLLMILIVSTILMFIYLFKTSCYDASEWHTIEHKLAYLIENSYPLSTENFKKVSMKHKRCGSKNKFLREPSSRKIKMAIEAGSEYLNVQ